jgi:Ca-activated chloride channel homolog
MGAEVETSPSLLAADKPTELLARVRLRGFKIEGIKRPPLNIALVVDTSGSMDGAAMDRTREACDTLVDSLAEGDALAIVAFGSSAEVLLPSQRVTKDSRALAKAAVKKMRAEGTTDMAGGLREGIGQAQRLIDPTGINRIVLLGDGVPNDPGTVASLGDQARNLRLPVTALGLGPDFNETLMTNLASRSGGTYHFIDDATKVASVFKQEISKLERLAAKSVFVEIVPGPGVTILETIGTPSSPIGRGVRLSIGDLSEEQQRDLIVKARVSEHRNGSKAELFDVVANYAPPNGDGRLTSKAFLALETTNDLARIKSAPKDDIEHQAVRFRVADGILNAIALARAGDVPGANKLLDAVKKLATEGGKKWNDAALTGKVKEITDLKKTVASLAPPRAPVGARPRGPEVDMVPSASPAAAIQLRKTHAAAVSDME